MKHLGDITLINGAEIEPVDVVCGGSPCQDLSTAGKRAGLSGERSGLFMEQIRIIKEMREHDRNIGRTDELVRPRYMVWENVPGAFSSNKGKDFAAVLEETIRIAEPEAPTVCVPEHGWAVAGCFYDPGGKWSVAWRVHDAQFWGVPQRRKRIALVADFNGWSAGKVLFESEGLPRYSPKGFRARKETSGCSSDSSGETGCHVAIENHPSDSRVKLSEDGKVQTLTSRMGTGGNNVPLLLKIRSGCDGGGKGPLIQRDRSATLSCNNDQTLFAPKVYGICSKDSNAMKSTNPHSGFYEAETTRCLDGNGGNPTCNQGGMAVVALEGNGSRPSHKGDGYKETDVMYTLNATEQHGIAHPTFSSSKTSFFTDAEEELANTLVATDYKDPPLINDKAYGFYPQMKAECVCLSEEKSGCLVNGTNPGFQNGILEPDYIVRRLTPTECERLQGFPDGWTDIGDWVDSKGKKHKATDSPRYKALGNSIAVGYANRQSGFWMWLLKRISANFERSATMGSLFDGIGGFPLAWEFYNGKGSARWASEIEEFPIAVTKIHFPEEN